MKFIAKAPRSEIFATTVFEGLTTHTTFVVCPNCGVRADDYFKPNYCSQCGQKFLWEDKTHGKRH